MDIIETIKCEIPNWNSVNAYPWVKWDNKKVFPVSVNFGEVHVEVYIKRPDGKPNHVAKVQVYSFDDEITNVAYYKYNATGSELTILVFI